MCALIHMITLVSQCVRNMSSHTGTSSLFVSRVHIKTGLALYSWEIIHSINHLFRATSMAQQFLLIYMGLTSSMLKTPPPLKPSSCINYMSYNKMSKSCVIFIHLLCFDLHMPLTLDDHWCIRLNWVQVMDQRAYLVFWTDEFAESE